MDKPRLAYYSDAHYFHAKRLDPPLSVHKLNWPVDELVGQELTCWSSAVDYGGVYFHQSKIGRVVGREKEVREVIRRGREKGMAVFPSLKL